MRTLSAPSASSGFRSSFARFTFWRRIDARVDGHRKRKLIAKPSRAAFARPPIAFALKLRNDSVTSLGDSA
jgi:hypothetical protein